VAAAEPVSAWAPAAVVEVEVVVAVRRPSAAVSMLMQPSQQGPRAGAQASVPGNSASPSAQSQAAERAAGAGRGRLRELAADPRESKIADRDTRAASRPDPRPYT
jgi:hypothetical protein